MANFCSNDLIIRVATDGMAEFIDNLLKAAKKSDGIIPFPETLPNEPVFFLEGTQDIGIVSGLSFSTRWKAPIPFAETLASKFPKSEFEIHYLEPGNRLGGAIFFSEGVLHVHHGNSKFWEAYDEMLDMTSDIFSLVEEKPYQTMDLNTD